MRTLLIGYGKMGKTIEKILKQRKHEIVKVIDINNQNELYEINPSEVDVAIEFTGPLSAFENLSICIKKQIPVITGTTGWLERYDEIKNLCTQHNGTILHASNFSLGVNIFFKLTETLSKIMEQYPQYEPNIEEIHHTEKLDKPSGTAISMAKIVMEQNKKIKSYVVDVTKENNTQLEIHSKRIANFAGTHTISYESEIDNIKIIHEANNREGFALGAVLVAEWIKNKKGVFTINDFFKF